MTSQDITTLNFKRLKEFLVSSYHQIRKSMPTFTGLGLATIAQALRPGAHRHMRFEYFPTSFWAPDLYQ
jgi:hypothetical protein